MKIKQLENGTFVGDFQGLYGTSMDLMLKRFILKLNKDDIAEIILDDSFTYENLIMLMNDLGCEILQNKLNNGTFSIKFRRSIIHS